MKRILSMSLILAVVLPLFAQTNNSPEITIDELKAHIAYLASDELGGRKPGTEGGDAAADYIRKNLAALNLETAVENYYQSFDVVTDIVAGTDNKLFFDGFEGKFDEDFTALSNSESAELTASSVFVGYGFEFDGENLSWHDYKDIDVKGKWAIVLRGAPTSENHSDVFDNYTSLRKKILVARDKEAAGVIFVSSGSDSEKDELIKLSYSRGETSVGLPVIHIKRSAADKIISSAGVSLEELEEHYKTEQFPYSFEIANKISAKVDLKTITAKTQNITGILRGSDPLLKNEYIFLGAHYDHLGMGGMGSGSRTPDTLAIHNGADDNASGTAAIIEIIEKLAANKDNLKRSVVYMSFAAEEMGLLGSKQFTNEPFVDLSAIKFMFNLDMVGRLDTSNSLTVGGTGTAAGWEEILKSYSENSGINVKTSPEGYGPSDHASFYAKDIPVAFFFTGVHEDYHTPEDDTEKINFEGEKKIADLVYELVLEVANRDESFAYQEAGPKEQQSASRRFKVTLGIMPDVASSGNNGLQVDAVIEGKPAFNSGMKKGDIIVAMDGKEVKDIYDYMNRLSEFKNGQTIPVDVMRGEEKVTLQVEL
ncbi:MAG: M20/M25/M40 family metallo-hydrolase [Bacteroidetes bacterium]|nr:M20/M25/M40 family metallo-hydrolase [Bacteroidota bacterium]